MRERALKLQCGQKCRGPLATWWAIFRYNAQIFVLAPVTGKLRCALYILNLTLYDMGQGSFMLKVDD